MCNLCKDIISTKERLNGYNCTGVPLGETIEFQVWENENPTQMTLWYTEEGMMKGRKTFLELEFLNNSKNGRCSGVRLVFPIKYCPICGRKLII